MPALIAILFSLLSISWLQLTDNLIEMARRRGGMSTTIIDSMIPVSTIDEVARSATVIVRGVVVGVPQHLSDDETAALPRYEVRPLLLYKGAVPIGSRPGASTAIIIVHPGGTLSVDGMRLTTAVNIYPEDEFLKPGESV